MARILKTNNATNRTQILISYLAVNTNIFRLHTDQPVSVFREISTAYYENHAKRINTLRWENVVFVNVQISGTHCNQWALNG
jgi:hypothetical protein